MTAPFLRWIEEAGLVKKDYQVKGIEWMLKHETSPETIVPDAVRGGILGDEMGLGKTIQILGLLKCNRKAHNLIVVPPALLNQWKDVIEELTDETLLVYHGAEKASYSVSDLKEVDIVLTTYGMISTKIIGDEKSEEAREIPSLLSTIEWGRVIYDEAHHLRNNKTRKHRGSLTMKSQATWLVTGTPIQNSLNDFYSLCAVLKIPKGELQSVENITRVVKAILLKRTKKGVGLKMPPINVTNIDVEWADENEKRLAESIHAIVSFTTPTRDNIDTLVKMLGQSYLPILIRMRQVCVLPALLEKIVHKYISDDEFDTENLDKSVVPGLKGTSKMKAIYDLVMKRKSNGRSKLIFCHFRQEIDWLNESFKKAGLKSAFIDGRVSQKERAVIMKSKQFDVVILQIRTACEGLNLQQFKEVYFSSPHWNPFVEDQAIARSHRFGQDANVDVFRFQMADFDDGGLTLDGYCRKVQETKREISRDLFG